MRLAFAQEAELLLDKGTDSRAPGGAVTLALCGHWEHDGPCRWPHHSAIETEGCSARLRTGFASTAKDEPTVRRRMEEGLRCAEGWTVLSIRPAELNEDERELGRRLA